VKSTRNVLRWLTLTTSLLLLTNLTGCASLDFFSKEDVKPIEVISKPIEKTPLAIQLPDPISVKPIKWAIVTKENAEAILTQIEATGSDPVVFGLTDDGYQQLSLTVGEMRNLIAQYREILIKYQEYYEPQGSKEKKQ
jgi:hypothetical protein